MAGVTMQLSVQYVQIYQEQLTDLISGNPVTLRQRADRAELHGCSEHEIHSMDDVLHLLSIGEERKVSLSLSPRLSLVSLVWLHSGGWLTTAALRSREYHRRYLRQPR